ncbi:protein-glutamate O-methyltransferase [Diachasma alloeum]|uniref:protein-glutamate O-methyltransferase n=1 Tax=Diachasma alloeum TaxID=454923 RepID=UPI00073836C7|nr:protein-glutamate O-methyltransferase [Diachasma alloeum]
MTFSVLSESVVTTLLFGVIITVSCDTTDVNSKMATTNSSDDIKGLQDIETPVGARLSGKYRKSFAYFTMKDRAPVILTKIIDTMSRNKESIINKYGKEASEELKQVMGNISQVRSELMTNKPLQLLTLSNSEKNGDARLWNDYIRDKGINDSSPVTWFETDWLLCETYMYRRLWQFYALTKTLSSLDCFEEQKEYAFTGALNSISELAKYTLYLANKSEHHSEDKKKEEFQALMKLNLWGNRCDLSHSVGAAINASEHCGPADSLSTIDPNLLIDDSSAVWDLLNKRGTDEDIVVDVVLDNAGYEFFTDLCLAVFMTHHKLAKKIRFYVKKHPWYISDVTGKDFKWTIESMKNSSDSSVQEFGDICENYLKRGAWSIEDEPFWTSPYDFSQMKSEAPDLYSKLSESKLVIFKGDLNYRKLVGDINWESTTDLVTALRGFRPSNLVTLRTLKADVCVGLPPGKAVELRNKHGNNDWLVSGQYGVIHATIDAQVN